jgi:hypothetical protein
MLADVCSPVGQSFKQRSYDKPRTGQTPYLSSQSAARTRLMNDGQGSVPGTEQDIQATEDECHDGSSTDFSMAVKSFDQAPDQSAAVMGLVEAPVHESPVCVTAKRATQAQPEVSGECATHRLNASVPEWTPTPTPLQQATLLPLAQVVRPRFQAVRILHRQARHAFLSQLRAQDKWMN